MADDMADTVSRRALARIREEMERKNLNQTDIAGILEWGQSRTSKILNGRTELGLEELDALCFAVGIRITEAVRDRGMEFSSEMTPTELRMLERFQQSSPAVRDAFLLLLDVKTRIAQPERHAGPLAKRPPKRG